MAVAPVLRNDSPSAAGPDRDPMTEDDGLVGAADRGSRTKFDARLRASIDAPARRLDAPPVRGPAGARGTAGRAARLGTRSPAGRSWVSSAVSCVRNWPSRRRHFVATAPGAKISLTLDEPVRSHQVNTSAPTPDRSPAGRDRRRRAAAMGAPSRRLCVDRTNQFVYTADIPCESESWRSSGPAWR